MLQDVCSRQVEFWPTINPPEVVVIQFFSHEFFDMRDKLEQQAS